MGVVIGVAFGQVIAPLVADVIMPLIGALGSLPDFSALWIGPVWIGRFLNAVLSFIGVGVAIYFLIVWPREVWERRRQAAAPAPSKFEEVKLLRAILEELRQKKAAAS